MSSSVHLHILYDGGKGSGVGGGSTNVDPKVPTGQAIVAAGLRQFAHAVQDKGRHLMHDKFIVRDGASVWTGSGNFTNGGLLLQDNNYLVIDSPAVAALYAKAFGDIGAPGHTVSHTKGTPGGPGKVKAGNVKLSVFFSTQFTEAENIETEVQKHLTGAKRVRVMAMLI